MKPDVNEETRPTHLDIFSGIGGFAIAAQWAGFETVGFCEAEPRCRAFLEKSWGKPVHPDIRTFDAKPYRGISLLTGGPPCQPASRAGKQGGEGDDRWLWPEALRVLEEAKPDCVVFENPPGILDVGIDGILSEMGRIGYEVQPFDIPACAVDAPHLRHRIWFVGFMADTDECGEPNVIRGATGGELAQRHPTEGDSDNILADTRRERSGQDEQGRRPDRRAVDRRDCADNVENAECERGCGRQVETGRGTWDAGDVRTSGEKHWSNSVWVPCADGKLRRAPDDSFGLVDGLHRSLLAALGNSIAPEVAFQILSAARRFIRT